MLYQAVYMYKSTNNMYKNENENVRKQNENNEIREE